MKGDKLSPTPEKPREKALVEKPLNIQPELRDKIPSSCDVILIQQNEAPNKGLGNGVVEAENPPISSELKDIALKNSSLQITKVIPSDEDDECQVIHDSSLEARIKTEKTQDPSPQIDSSKMCSKNSTLVETLSKLHQSLNGSRENSHDKTKNNSKISSNSLTITPINPKASVPISNKKTPEPVKVEFNSANDPNLVTSNGVYFECLLCGKSFHQHLQFVEHLTQEEFRDEKLDILQAKLKYAKVIDERCLKKVNGLIAVLDLFKSVLTISFRCYRLICNRMTMDHLDFLASIVKGHFILFPKPKIMS